MTDVMREAVHALVYGFSGSKKSTLAATFPTPQYTCMFDAYGMDGPYIRRGNRTESGKSPLGIPIKRVYHGKELLTELHYYHDLDPEQPDAWELFRAEQKVFDPTAWATWIVDSMSEAIDAAKFEQQKLNPRMAPFRQLGPVTDQMSLHFKTRPKSYECNVVLIAHVAQKFVDQPSMQQGQPGRRIEKRQESAFEDEEGGQIVLRGIVAPGRLGRDGGLAAQYSEVYRAYIELGEGKPVYRLQTQGDGVWVAKSQLNAPDGCPPDYEALWENVDGV